MSSQNKTNIMFTQMHNIKITNLEKLRIFKQSLILFHSCIFKDLDTHSGDNGEAHYSTEIVVSQEPAACSNTPHDARKESYTENHAQNNIRNTEVWGKESRYSRGSDGVTWQNCFRKHLRLVSFDDTVKKEIHCTSQENPTILCKYIIQIYMV